MKFFRLKTWIRRTLVRKMNLNRPTAYPFITGDGFRALAEHFFDEVSDLDPLRVNDRDIIYVRGDFLREFFKTKHPHIRNSYILISNNGDTNITEDYGVYIDEKIIHWFGQNFLFSHPKMTPTPIGLTNTFSNHIGTLSDFQSIMRQTASGAKKPGMTHGFSLISNAERLTLNTMLRGHKNAHEIERKSQSDYFREIANYQFLVSPEGNGADCHRTWEALYLGIIPIVKRSHFTEYFKSLGLPMIMVSDWKEINSFDEAFLSQKYAEMKAGFDHPAIYMEYWMDRVMEKKIKGE